MLAPRHGELELLDENAVKNFFKKNVVDVVIHSAVKPGHRNAKDPSNPVIQQHPHVFSISTRSKTNIKKMIFITGI